MCLGVLLFVDRRMFSNPNGCSFSLFLCVYCVLELELVLVLVLVCSVIRDRDACVVLCVRFNKSLSVCCNV